MATRLDAETVLISGAIGYGALLGLTVGMPSPVALLSDPIAEGLAACGVTPANPVNPTDADFTLLQASLWRKFVAVAGLRLLELATEVAISKPISRESPTYKVSYDPAAMVLLLKDKRANVLAQFQYGGPSLSAGSIRLPSRLPCSEF